MPHSDAAVLFKEQHPIGTALAKQHRLAFFFPPARTSRGAWGGETRKEESVPEAVVLHTTIQHPDPRVGVRLRRWVAVLLPTASLWHRCSPCFAVISLPATPVGTCPVRCLSVKQHELGGLASSPSLKQPAFCLWQHAAWKRDFSVFAFRLTCFTDLV